jgi:hypothetical protein
MLGSFRGLARNSRLTPELVSMERQQAVPSVLFSKTASLPSSYRLWLTPVPGWMLLEQLAGAPSLLDMTSIGQFAARHFNFRCQVSETPHQLTWRAPFPSTAARSHEDHRQTTMPALHKNVALQPRSGKVRVTLKVRHPVDTHLRVRPFPGDHCQRLSSVHSSKIVERNILCLAPSVGAPGVSPAVSSSPD